MELDIKDIIQNNLEGMKVSVDVSTGEHYSYNRYFGKITEVIDTGGNEKYGLVILVQDGVYPNFKLNNNPEAWKVTFTDDDHSFTKIYSDECEKDHWVRLHILAGFDVKIVTLFSSEEG